ncbi:MAG TPA: hypothetical protein PK992_01205 [Planctomycetaceae bacterium]|nr:hypothetical protein [Planctomycetaceae bacterium]
MRQRHLYLGLFAWLGISLACWLALRGTNAQERQSVGEVIGGIGRWISGAQSEWMASSQEDVILAFGDPILMRQADGTFRQVGLVRNHFTDAPKEAVTKKAAVILYDEVAASCPDGFYLEYHTTPTALEWVVRTMVPPERQHEISKLIADDWKSHRKEVMAQLQPVMEKSLAHAVREIEAMLPATIQNHRSEFGELADRYQAEIIRRQIVPLVRQEILPIVEEELTPAASELGKVLWDRVSLWSFTWRYLYDASPLPEKNAVKTEFDRFLDQEVRPQLEARSDQFVVITQRIIARVSRNERVRSVIRENLRKIASDPELQAIIWSVVQEAILQNNTLKNSLSEYWKSDEVQDALQVANIRFEPTARAIGVAIFGNREKGITPEFSRVLRSQILLKDRRWLVVVPITSESTDLKIEASLVTGSSGDDDLSIVTAAKSMEFPIEFEGTAQSPLTHLESQKSANP